MTMQIAMLMEALSGLKIDRYLPVRYSLIRL
jgi:hypothetical protein